MIIVLDWNRSVSSKSRYNSLLNKPKRKGPRLLPKDQYAADIDGNTIRPGDLVYIIEWKPVHLSYSELGSAGQFKKVEESIYSHDTTGDQIIVVKTNPSATSIGVWMYVSLRSKFVRRV